MAEPPKQKAGRAGKPRPTEATAAVVREKGAKRGEDVTMNGPLYKRKSANVVLVRRQRRKDEGAFRLLASLFVENQIGEYTLLLCLPPFRGVRDTNSQAQPASQSRIDALS